MPRRSFMGILLVITSIPEYTCMESALMILAPDQPFGREVFDRCSASSTAKSDFPTPVVPKMAIIGRKAIGIG